MAENMLEKRVAALEHEVADLRVTLAGLPKKDWRQTIGMFTDNPGMLELFEEALKIRAEDRRRTRPKARRSHKPKK